MTSIGTIIGDLEAIKGSLAEARNISEETEGHTEEVATLAQGMDLEDAAKNLNELKSEIHRMSERFTEFAEGIDKLIAKAEALRNGSPTGRGKIGLSKVKSIFHKPWKPQKKKQLSRDLQRTEREIERAPTWSQRLASKYSTEMTTIMVGGVTQAAGQLAHLPPGIQVLFTTASTTLAIRKVNLEEAEKARAAQAERDKDD